jgi:MFS family permease
MKNPIEQKKERNLRLSYLNGIFASGMTGFTQEYFTPFLLLIGGTAQHVGFLSAFPNFFSALVQLFSADLTEKIKSRKRVVVIFMVLQALTLLLICAMAFTGHSGIPLFITLIVLFTAFGALANPAWGSLLGDLVAAEKRGEYFGWRNKNLGFLIVVMSLIAGAILHRMKAVNIYLGFVILFGLAFCYRLVSGYFVIIMTEPAFRTRREHHFSIVQFLARLKESNFAKFVLFISLMSFSVNLAAPFFAVLMLRDLGFSYLLYAMLNMASTLAIYFFMSRWGIHADKIGNLKIIKFTAPLIGVIPLLWVFNRNPVFLFFAQVFSGFMWAGFNLCSTNFIYDAVTPEKLTRCIAFFNVLNGVALSAGALLGGLVVQYLPSLFGNKILMLLVFSSILRIVVGLALPSKLREVRPIKKVSSNELFFSMMGVRPILGIERKTIRF